MRPETTAIVGDCPVCGTGVHAFEPGSTLVGDERQREMLCYTCTDWLRWLGVLGAVSGLSAAAAEGRMGPGWDRARAPRGSAGA